VVKRELLLLLVLSCGGDRTAMDASVTDSSTTDVLDARSDDDAWWKRFDVAPFSDAQREPRLNEYPPYDGKPCWEE
jgi:hypothetical protein